MDSIYSVLSVIRWVCCYTCCFRGLIGLQFSQHGGEISYQPASSYLCLQNPYLLRGIKNTTSMEVSGGGFAIFQ